MLFWVKIGYSASAENFCLNPKAGVGAFMSLHALGQCGRSICFGMRVPRERRGWRIFETSLARCQAGGAAPAAGFVSLAVFIPGLGLLEPIFLTGIDRLWTVAAARRPALTIPHQTEQSALPPTATTLPLTGARKPAGFHVRTILRPPALLGSPRFLRRGPLLYPHPLELPRGLLGLPRALDAHELARRFVALSPSRCASDRRFCLRALLYGALAGIVAGRFVDCHVASTHSML